MYCCALQTDSSEVLKLFFAATQLPITALTPEGVASCPQDEGVLPPCRQGFEGEVKTGSDNFYFVPICPCGKKAGMFVLGPYTNTPDSSSGLSYRPKEVWVHLVGLLRTLQKSQMGECSNGHCLPVHRAQRIVDRYYAHEISLHKIAQHLGLNKSYLSTLYKQETGQSFTD